MSLSKRILLKPLAIFAFYFAVIGLFYIQHPLQNSIFGNLDSWANLAVFHELLNWIDNGFILNGKSFLYPSAHPWVLYGLDFFTGIIWVFYYKLGFSEVWAYWLYITTLLALNSASLYFLSKIFFRRNTTALLLGAIFSLNPILYENLINPNVLSYFFFFTSLHCLITFSNSNKLGFLVLSAILGAFQIYASPVVFVFFVVFAGIYLLFNHFNKILNARHWSLFALLVFLAIISPYLYWYLISPLPCDGVLALVGEEAKNYTHLYYSLDILDFLRYNTLAELYPILEPFNSSIEPLVSLKNMKIGLLLSFFFAISFWSIQSLKRVLWLILILVIYLLLAFGKYIFVGHSAQVLNPIYFLWEYLHLLDFIRIPSRLGLPIYLVISMIALWGAEELVRYKLKSKVAYTLILLALLAEPLLADREFNKPEHDYLTLVNTLENQQVFNDEELVLFLPSALFSSKKDTREFIYMMAGARLNVNILNGSGYCLPIHRIDMQKILTSNDLDAVSFCEFLEKSNVDKVVVFTDLVLDSNDEEQLSVASNSSCLSLNLSLQKIQVFSKK